MNSFHSIAYFAQNEASGHFYNYHMMVHKAMKPLCQDVSVYVSKNSSFERLPEGWIQWFSPFYNRRNRRKFWKDCVRLFRQSTSLPRVFFIEFFGRRDFLLYSLAALLFAKKRDSLWVLYRDDLTIRRKKDLSVIRFFSKLLNWKYRKNFIPLTDSELLVDDYAQWFGKRPTVLPILYGPFQAVAPITKQKIICSWIGSPRPEKGSCTIAKLVQIQDPASERIELCVSGATYLPAIKNKISLHLIKAFLSEDEYYQTLMRSDVVLLPYEPEKYKKRTSGIFVETILAGKIPFVKEGSWLAYELKKFDLYELILDWENEQVFTQILERIQDTSIIDKLSVMQQAYLNFHGEENFARTLHRLCLAQTEASEKTSSHTEHSYSC
ncbi:MAG: glycosyltransferase [Verrucomicrobia bacterium]|nr:glycosyltransferase [Verrucomicrobiota bacterium]